MPEASFLQDPIRGARYLLAGLQLIGRPGIRRFVVVPAAISAVLFVALLYAVVTSFGDVVENYVPEGWAWLQWILWPLFAVVFALVMVFTYTILTNLIGTPFNGLLAAAVERHLEGQPADTGQTWQEMLGEMRRSLLDELPKLLYFTLGAIPFLLLFLVPVVNVLAGLVWMVYAAWVMALQYSDYPMGNHQVLFRNQRQLLRRRVFLALGFGGGSLFLTLIPVLNFIAMPASVAGATVMWLEEFATAPPVGEAAAPPA